MTIYDVLSAMAKYDGNPDAQIILISCAFILGGVFGMILGKFM